VDFSPPKLEDFAQSLDDPNYDDLPDVTSSGDSWNMTDMPKPRWEWAFWLLLEEAKTAPGETPIQIKVLVSGADAVYMLKIDADK
jgi:protection of telomeres protein 1